MPIYEYFCHRCRGKRSLFWQTVSAATSAEPRCPKCGSERLTKIVSRVAFLRSAGSRLDELADPDGLAAIDPDDPRAMGKWMRRMGDELGDELGDDFGEMVERVEAGEDPESM